MANELDAWFGIYCGVIGLVVCAYMFFFSSITDRKVLFFKEPKQVRDLLLAIVIVGPVLVVILNIVFVYQSTYKLHGKSIKGLLGMQIGFYLLQTLYVFIVAPSAILMANFSETTKFHWMTDLIIVSLFIVTVLQIPFNIS